MNQENPRYSFAIAATTDMLFIRFDGVYTAAAHDTATSAIITATAPAGNAHGSPKCEVTIASKNALLSGSPAGDR